MKAEQIDIEIQTILTVKSIGGGVHVTPAMVCDALEADGYVLEADDIKKVAAHTAQVKAAALEIMWGSK